MTLSELQSLWASSITQQSNELPNLDLASLEIEVHTASWCPDCVREVSELLALDKAASRSFKNVTLLSYENKDDYIAKKSSGGLNISCLPTIVIKDQHGGIEVIKEDSRGGVTPIIKSLLSPSS